jgi:tripeptide aminopeptidase
LTITAFSHILYKQMDVKEYTPWFEKKLLTRFTRYVKIETTSSKHGGAVPSSKGQLRFASLLAKELTKIGLSRAAVDENGFVYAVLPAAGPGREKHTIGFMAHMDTSPDVTAKNVTPLVHEHYSGKAITLKGGVALDPRRSPALKAYKNRTIITSDGTTLLGADDKAGVAEIMTALEFLAAHPEIPHPAIEVIFTPDEETGRGMSRFPLKTVRAGVCFTLDGDEEGAVEVECFEAYSLRVVIIGRSIHLGEARGKLINAVELAALFVTMLPKNESPQATDGRLGYYCCVESHAALERAELEVLIRDFNPAECTRRIAAVKSAAAAVRRLYPGARITVEVKKQYANMRSSLKKYPGLIPFLKEAVRQSGALPRLKHIRGGTDGARLCQMGIPTPNIFTGGHNFHSRTEWAALPAMVKAAVTIIHIAMMWPP